MSETVVTIEDWAVVQSITSHTFGELYPGNRLIEYAVRHPYFTKGMLVFTSPILSVDLDQGVGRNTQCRYRLGEASDEYKSWVNKRRTAAAKSNLPLEDNENVEPVASFKAR